MSGLRVLVAGTGFAGKGHAQAFRAAGAEIVGMVGRTDHVVRDVSAELSIPCAGTDWPAALAALKPDVVSIATPGGAHYEQIKEAIAAGCHVFCDKPMTTDGASATALHELAQAKGVKTAYAASFQYTPSVQHAKRLIATGAIGEPTEIESISHFNLERGIPFGWSHRAEEGGGRLNNNFTHSLAIAQTLIEGDILQIAGDVRDDLGRAPKVEGVHDFTKRRAFIPENLDDPALEWGESNVEWSYTVMARLRSPLARKPVSVLFKHGGLVPRFHDDHIAIYGTKGAIFLTGHYGAGTLYWHDGSSWIETPTPDDIAQSVPAGLGETEQCWHVLTAIFVRDIDGQDVPAYPTFAQGALYQRLIDHIRASGNWTDVNGGCA
ncbi:Gfo/Idh/MocA family protein [Cognatishimia sp. F0-27]|uniref:Gfo/Idh/MocA family protein n=1 Tax=Cognatishimia sp. F0-27 TaxID=2816855 RepID=UPI001D0C0F89|nr:Gfo/Idh/MocA family oxidoreductase [Cognatishimia sp. F0-27]MCC1491802.1 Gfo/Idh/MocA family oxidoreductase [Cognatishimia sp. F0-27]